MVIVNGDPYAKPEVKKKLKLNSYYIKASLLHYFRFYKQFDYVATECDTDSWTKADVLCYTGNRVIEVEVKTSRGDLRGDKIHKEKKHSSRKEAVLKEYNGKVITETTRATHFYFCVPEELKEIALEEVETINPKYGVMVCYENDNIYGHELGKNIKIVKKAKELHSLPLIKDNILRKIARRNASELAFIYKNDYVDIHREKV